MRGASTLSLTIVVVVFNGSRLNCYNIGINVIIVKLPTAQVADYSWTANQLDLLCLNLCI